MKEILVGLLVYTFPAIAPPVVDGDVLAVQCGPYPCNPEFQPLPPRRPYPPGYYPPPPRQVDPYEMERRRQEQERLYQEYMRELNRYRYDRR